MFGYLQPYKPMLLVKEYEYYKGIYCSLCKQLGKDYGVLARFTLSYDCTFYAMLAMGLQGTCPQFKKGRCAFNPMKQCNYCTQGDRHLSLAAAVSVVSVYYKLEDDIRDSGFLKRNVCRFLRMIAKRWKKKAEKEFSAVDAIVKNMSALQCRAEEGSAYTIDILAEPTAVMLKQLMEILAKNEEQKAVYGEFGYFLGKWIYLMDAADDFEKDLKSGAANPFVSVFKDKQMHAEEQTMYMNGVLNETVSRIIPAYNLIELKTNNGFFQNIMDYGLGQMQKAIVFKQKAKESNADKEQIKL